MTKMDSKLKVGVVTHN